MSEPAALLQDRAFSSNVQPKRRMAARPAAWLCDCRKAGGTPKENPGYVTRCHVCGVARRNGAALSAALGA